MLGKVCRHLQFEADPTRHARRVHFHHVFALERVIQRQRIVIAVTNVSLPSTRGFIVDKSELEEGVKHSARYWLNPASGIGGDEP